VEREKGQRLKRSRYMVSTITTWVFDIVPLDCAASTQLKRERRHLEAILQCANKVVFDRKK
jgi:hypothetical protein